jgi:transcriptional regulator with XRE-family HTH domain
MLSDYQERCGRDLPKTIRAIRLGKGLTGAKFGQIIKTPEPRLSNWERGVERPGVTGLIRLLPMSEGEGRDVLVNALESQGLSVSDLSAAVKAAFSDKKTKA